MKKTTVLFVCAIILAGFAATTATAADTTKLGHATVLSDQHEIEIKKDLEVSSLVFRVKSHQVRLEDVTVDFSDGTQKTVESHQILRPGFDSEPIDLDTSGVVTKVTLGFNTQGWRASTRAFVTVYGS